MNDHEKALAVKGGRTFADLCDDVRQARVEHLRAFAAVERAQQQLKTANERLLVAMDDEHKARDALDALIERETDVDE